MQLAEPSSGRLASKAVPSIATVPAHNPCSPCPRPHPSPQNRQAADAAQRPPFKRWVDEDIIERQFREKQEALAKEVGLGGRWFVERSWLGGQGSACLPGSVGAHWRAIESIAEPALVLRQEHSLFLPPPRCRRRRARLLLRLQLPASVPTWRVSWRRRRRPSWLG